MSDVGKNLIALFCDACGRYMEHYRKCQGCGWERPDPEEILHGALPGPCGSAPTLVPRGRRAQEGVRWVVVPWGEPGGPVGGIVALDASTMTEVWRYPARGADPTSCAAVEAPIGVIGERLAFCDRTGRIHVLDTGPDDVRAVRTAPPSIARGSISHAPVAANRSGTLALAATSEGHVLLLDLTGDAVIADVVQLRAADRAHVRVQAQPVEISGGAFVVVAIEVRPGVVTREGGLFRIDVARGALVVDRIAAWPAPLYGAPLVVGDRLLLADVGIQQRTDAGGAPREGACAWLELGARSARSANPVPNVGGQLRAAAVRETRRGRQAAWLASLEPGRLWRIDIEGGSAPAHAEVAAGIEGAPILVKGRDLVAVVRRDGAMTTFESAPNDDGTIAPAWTWWPTDDTAHVVGAVSDGTWIYAATDAGDAYRVPYHGGNLTWLRSAATKARDPLLEAAVTRHIEVGWNTNGDADKHVARSLHEARRFEDAAKVHLALGNHSEAAESFQALRRWDLAAACWLEAGATEKVERCRRKAAEQDLAPWIALAPITEEAEFRVGVVTPLTLEFQNENDGKARNLVAEVRGHNARVAFGQVRSFSRAELPKGQRWRVSLDRVVPGEAGAVQLRVLVTYQNDARTQSTAQEFTIPLQVAAADQPPQVTQITAENYFEQTHDVKVNKDSVELIETSAAPGGSTTVTSVEEDSVGDGADRAGTPGEGDADSRPTTRRTRRPR